MIRKKNAKRVIVRGSVVSLTWLLSEREIEVLRLLTQGNTNKIMSAKLGISEKTIETHRSNINDKIRQLTGHTYPTEALVHMAVLSGITAPMTFPFLKIDHPPVWSSPQPTPKK